MIQIAGRLYELIHEHKNAWNPEAFKGRYSDVLDRYDYIIGDWGYNQLRLKGFYKEGHPKATKESTIASLVDYINEYCNFGCAYFVLQKAPGSKRPEGEYVPEGITPDEEGRFVALDREDAAAVTDEVDADGERAARQPEPPIGRMGDWRQNRYGLQRERPTPVPREAQSGAGRDGQHGKQRDRDRDKQSGGGNRGNQPGGNRDYQEHRSGAGKPQSHRNGPSRHAQGQAQGGQQGQRQHGRGPQQGGGLGQQGGRPPRQQQDRQRDSKGDQDRQAQRQSNGGPQGAGGGGGQSQGQGQGKNRPRPERQEPEA